MGWLEPETDWNTNDGIMNTDLNRIEGNIEYLYNRGASVGILSAEFTGTISSSSQGDKGIDPTKIIAIYGTYLNTASWGGNYYTPIGGGGTLSGVDVAVKSGGGSDGHLYFKNIGAEANGKPYRVVILYTD
jgi:hypothetical protein